MNDTIKDYEFKLNYAGSTSNLEGNIWLLWKSGIICSIIHSTAQYIFLSLEIGGIQVNICFVHARYEANVR